VEPKTDSKTCGECHSTLVTLNILKGKRPAPFISLILYLFIWGLSTVVVVIIIVTQKPQH
jgi:hypothetical protein